MVTEKNFVSRSLIYGIVIGGFVFGFFHCSDCDWSIIGIIGRVIVGLIFMILTPLCLGFVPENEAGTGGVYNVWPYILVVAAVCYAWQRIAEARREAN